MVAALDDRSVVTFAPHGDARRLLECRDHEILIEGPAGTGKSYACLWKVHLMALKYAGMRALMVRKTLTSLTSSALVTYTTRVLDSGAFGVRFFGGSKVRPAQFEYRNGSVVVVGGMDKPEKVMSSEYDAAYVNEATELTEADWEAITTRLRYGMMPYQQLIADCNPDAPTHWLNQRCEQGKTTRFRSHHVDNPLLWDGASWTEQGADYMARLGALTGVRRLRLLDGVWAAAEGIVYDGFSPEVHVIDHFDIPDDWPRYWVIDFGYVHPFVWQAWAEGPDGALYRYREIYRTERLVADHAQTIRRVTRGEPRPVAIITDHDAEDRATLDRALGMATTPAFKSISPGIQAVAERLRATGEAPARLFFLRESLVEEDPVLRSKAKPTRTEEEFASYIWDTRLGRRKGEDPLKEDDHGMDATRYLVAYVDEAGENRGGWSA